MDVTRTVTEYVSAKRGQLFANVQELVRRPSENTPPTGAEAECQQWLASRLERAGYHPDLYEIGSVSGLQDHPLFVGGRDYSGRPNLGVRRRGSGGGRSLILSGHIDTVPRGTQPWSVDPFGGSIEGDRLYGRGSNDMKAGVGISLFLMEAIADLGLPLAGDLVFETVIDEEFGGVNGTLAGRVRGYTADAAVLTEPSSLRICAAQRGGRTAHITFRAAGGILSDGPFPAGVIDQVRLFLNAVPRFSEQRLRNCRRHSLYAESCDPVPASVMKIVTAPWGTREPITTPEECRVEFYWQLMPGETQVEVEREFFEWMNGIVDSAPALFKVQPQIEFPIRWMPGSAIDSGEALVTELRDTAQEILRRPPPVAGIEGPCDMFVFHEFGIPAVLWGPSGGNTHAADEYVDLHSVVSAAEVLLHFVCRWCGLKN